MATGQLFMNDESNDILVVKDPKEPDIEEEMEADLDILLTGETEEEVSEVDAEFQKALKHNSESASDVVDATQIYLNEIGYTPLLTPEEETKYGRLALRGNKKARARMIECNLRLVVKIARRYMNRGMPLLDLIEEGNLGLMHAVEKFDPERGFRFSTYATWWIRQTIERAIMNQTRTIRLPIHVVKELNGYLRAGQEITKWLDQDATPEDIAYVLDKPLEDVQRMLGLNEKIASVDTTIGSNNDTSLLEMLADDNQDPADLLVDDDLNVHIEEWLHELTENQQQVLLRRFGLGGFERATLEEVGEAIGLTRERVRQIQVEALKALRKVLEKHGLTRDKALD
jgi:RNA polymerase nonessential primary-like sigma factor